MSIVTDEQVKIASGAFLDAPAGRQLRAALEAYEAAKSTAHEESVPVAPEGWKLVPLEETDEMIEAADNTKDHNVCCRTCASVAYRAMVKAAPAPPESK